MKLFHVKRERHAAAVVLLSALALLVISCTGGSASARGWAEPAATDDLILVSPKGGRLDAIDRQDQRFAWRFPDYWSIADSDARDLEGIYQAPIIADDGDTVLLAAYSGYLYAFRLSDALSSAEVAQGVPEPAAAALNFEDPIIGGLILEEATDTVYVAAGSRLHAISVSDFLRRLENPNATVLPRWSPFQADNDIWATPLESRNHIIVASLGGSVYAVNKATGMADWTFSTDSGLVTPPALSGGLIFVGGFAGRIHALELETGSQRWIFEASDWIWSQPRPLGDSLVFGDFSGQLYSVAITTGVLEWVLDLARGPIVSSPILAGGVLIVATEDGAILGLDPSDRSIIWERKLDTEITANFVQEGERVLLAPSGCVGQEGLDSDLYYISLDPASGNLEPALDVDC